jgi:hypothetical protein
MLTSIMEHKTGSIPLAFLTFYCIISRFDAVSHGSKPEITEKDAKLGDKVLNAG